MNGWLSSIGIHSNSVRPELVEGLCLRSRWFDRLTMNGLRGTIGCLRGSIGRKCTCCRTASVYGERKACRQPKPIFKQGAILIVASVCGIRVVADAVRPGGFNAGAFFRLPDQRHANSFQTEVVKRGCTYKVVVGIDGDVAVIIKTG